MAMAKNTIVTVKNINVMLCPNIFIVSYHRLSGHFYPYSPYILTYSVTTAMCVKVSVRICQRFIFLAGL